MPKEISRFMIAYSDISIDDEFNSRRNLGDLDGLAMTIDQHGLVQPMVVREGGPLRSDPSRRSYFLIAGNRRYRAIGLLRDPNWAPKADPKYKRKTTPASWNQVEVKRVKGDTQEAAELNLIENLQKEDLDPLEEAQALQRYMEKYKCSQADIARKFGKSEPYISQRLSLLKKTAPEVREAVEKGKITATHAREIATLPKDQQKEILAKVEAKREATGKDVSVAEVKEEADARKEKLGIKQERKRKNKEPEYNVEDVKVAKEVLSGVELTVRPKQALLEMFGRLKAKQERVSSAESKAELKHKLKALGWVLGVEQSL